ncbi:hypothetical protein GQ600_145 [Phytophthora cactorum]|nr:hypothetical protein GQ600_145 [Phytophthora cactorum]
MNSLMWTADCNAVNPVRTLRRYFGKAYKVSTAPRITWREVAVGLSAADAEELTDNSKRNAAGKSQCVTWTMCAEIIPHPMRYKLLNCRSKVCKNGFPGIACGWKLKITTCSQLNVASFLRVW